MKVTRILLPAALIAAASTTALCAWAESPDSTWAAPAPRPRKVLIIGIDGLRPDALARARTPNLDSLIAGGAFSDRTMTDARSRSGPGWTSIFTSAWSERHGVENNAFKGWKRQEHPTFLVRLRESRPGIRTGAVVHWAPIGSTLVGTDGFWMAPGGDAEVAAEAARLVRRGAADVLFVHFDDVDHAGHRFGFHPRMPFYVWAVERVDRRVGELLAALREREAEGEDWLVLSTSDHGGSYRHHGKDIPEHRTVFLLAHGAGIAPGREAEERGVIDLAPTAFAWLGIPVKPEWNWQGRPMGLAPALPAPEPGLAEEAPRGDLAQGTAQGTTGRQ